METLFFYLFAIPMVGAAAMVVLSRRPITSVLSLLVAMGCLACLFVVLGAYFVAALQILLYAGAVLVLFIFVIMLLNLQAEPLARARASTPRIAGAVVAAAALLQLLRALKPVAEQPSLSGAPAANGTVAAIGTLLFSRYLLPFELTSFIILAAIIAAVTLAKPSPRR